MPSVEAGLRLLADKLKVDYLTNARALAEVVDSVADLPKHSDDAHIARVFQLQVVLEAVPELAVERFVNVVEDRILSRV